MKQEFPTDKEIKKRIIYQLSPDERIPDRFFTLTVLREAMVALSKTELSWQIRLYFKILRFDPDKFIDFIDDINSFIPDDSYIRLSEDVSEVLIGRKGDSGSRKIINIKELIKLIIPIISERNKKRLEEKHIEFNQEVIESNPTTEKAIGLKILYILIHEDVFDEIDGIQAKSTDWYVNKIIDSIFKKD